MDLRFFTQFASDTLVGAIRFLPDEGEKGGCREKKFRMSNPECRKSQNH